MLMIEHDMDLVFRFARRVVVLAAGEIIFEGLPSEVAANAKVREAYLGNYAHARKHRLKSAASVRATARRLCWRICPSRCRAGARLSILGRNGMGKTTLLSSSWA